MRGIRFAALFALALAACDSTPAERASAACTIVCRCQLPPVPAQQEECVDECVPEFLQANVPEECTQCLEANATSCSTIELLCEDACDQPQPPIDDPVGDPPMI